MQSTEDSSQVSKIAFGENINYQSVDKVLPGNNKVLPISFSKEHKTMISSFSGII